jgi:hypothetical protein
MVFLIALGVVVVLGFGYYFSCRFWPYGPCFGCVGHGGRNRGSNSRRWGTCKRCRGTGRRIRLGARLWHTVERSKW